MKTNGSIYNIYRKFISNATLHNYYYDYVALPSAGAEDVELTHVHPVLFFLVVSVHLFVHRSCSGMP